MPVAYYEAAERTDDSYRQFFDREDGFCIKNVTTDFTLEQGKKYYAKVDTDTYDVSIFKAHGNNRIPVVYKPVCEDWKALYADYDWIDDVIHNRGFTMDYNVKAIYAAKKTSEIFMEHYVDED